MTTIRAKVKNGQLVIAAEPLGLEEGQEVELELHVENPFLKWVGAAGPLPDGEDSVSYYRKLRDGEGE